MLLVERSPRDLPGEFDPGDFGPQNFAARFISGCGFIDCAGLRDPATAARLSKAFRTGGEDQVRSLIRRTPKAASVWFAGDGWYLSTDAPAHRHDHQPHGFAMMTCHTASP